MSNVQESKALTDFLSRYQPLCEEVTTWSSEQFPLRVVSYFCAELPPLEFITSVRAIVIQDGQVLVLRDTDETHIVPGGRREPGETLAETLRREILEETGWLTNHYEMLGLWHFHHLNPRPPDFPYLYPDFLHVIYAAIPIKQMPEAKLDDAHELGNEFMPIEQARKIKFAEPSQLLFLDAALARQASTE